MTSTPYVSGGDPYATPNIDNALADAAAAADRNGAQGIRNDIARADAQFQVGEQLKDLQINRGIKNAARNFSMDLVADEQAFMKKANEKYGQGAAP